MRESSMTIYLDNSATTYPKPEEVYIAMDQAARTFGVNAGRGSYKLANKAEDIIQETRASLAKLTNFQDPNRVILLPSATIALNTIINGLNWEPGDNVFYSPFEHNSVLRPLNAIKNKYHIKLHEIPVDPETQIYKLEKLKEMYEIIVPKAAFISHASNVIGLIAPIKELTSLTHKYGGITIIDGAQALGAVPVDLSDIECDYYIFAGHKNLFGPIGIGGIYINTDELLKPFVIGGTGSQSEQLTMPNEYPKRLEAGSPNVVAVAGLKAGLGWLNKNRNVHKKEKELFYMLVEILGQLDNVTIHNKPSENNSFLPILSFSLDGYSPQEVAMILDQNYDIAVRAGLHCAPLAHNFINTLPTGSVRISLSVINTSHSLFELQSGLQNMS
jgi:cysteine desulfurase family protein